MQRKQCEYVRIRSNARAHMNLSLSMKLYALNAVTTIVQAYCIVCMYMHMVHIIVGKVVSTATNTKYLIYIFTQHFRLISIFIHCNRCGYSAVNYMNVSTIVSPPKPKSKSKSTHTHTNFTVEPKVSFPQFVFFFSIDFFPFVTVTMVKICWFLATNSHILSTIIRKEIQFCWRNREEHYSNRKFFKRQNYKCHGN